MCTIFFPKLIQCRHVYARTSKCFWAQMKNEYLDVFVSLSNIQLWHCAHSPFNSHFSMHSITKTCVEMTFLRLMFQTSRKFTVLNQRWKKFRSWFNVNQTFIQHYLLAAIMYVHLFFFRSWTDIALYWKLLNFCWLQSTGTCTIYSTFNKHFIFFSSFLYIIFYQFCPN